MIYLDSFYFVGPVTEERFLHDEKKTCYDSFYPYGILPQKGLSEMRFNDITILYGGNGSGKTTVLNIIAEKIGAERVAPYNRSNFFENYLQGCDMEYRTCDIENKAIITSDDVFDYMLDVRALNEQIDVKREERLQDYMEYRYKKFKFESMDQFEELRKSNLAKSRTRSQYVRKTLTDNIREYSNGESAFRYFLNHIEGNGIYILDEPENSLSPEKQLELIDFLQNSARHLRCQFIISTHSPFILSMEKALIYNLDSEPVSTADWHQLKNVQVYFKFFKKHEDEFARIGFT